MSNGFNTDGLYSVPEVEGFIINPLDSIECAISFDVKDWSTDRRSFWIYCIIFGIDSYEEYPEYKEEFNKLVKEYHWDDKDISRLRLLHEKWLKLKEMSKAGGL